MPKCRKSGGNSQIFPSLHGRDAINRPHRAGIRACRQRPGLCRVKGGNRRFPASLGRGRGHWVADAPVIFSGHGFSPQGDKCRYLLPPHLRKIVTQSSGNQNLLFVTRHESWNCLIGFGRSYYEKLHSEIDRDHEMAIRAGLPFDRAARDLIFGDVAETSYDASGRVILPAYLRKIVGIDDGPIYFHAARELFTMWAPAVLEAQEGSQWMVARAACASFMAGQTRGRR